MLEKYGVTFFRGIPAVLLLWIRGPLLVLLVCREHLPQKNLQNCDFNIVWDFPQRLHVIHCECSGRNYLLNISVIGSVDGKLQKELKHL